jgi:hypothetical protein
MRPTRRVAHTATVRFLLEIGRDGDGRVTGHVSRAGDGPARFSGWLELLRLLEERASTIDGDPDEGDGT